MSRVIMILLALAGFVQAKGEKILIIESYHKAYAWDASYLEGLREEFGNDYQLITYQMDTKRLPKQEHESRANRAWEMYQSEKPDLVILGDDNALRFLGKRFYQTDTPVVFLGLNNNPRQYVNVGKNITGILERPLLKRSIATIKDVVPEAEKVLVLFDDSTTAHATLDEIFKGRKSLNVSDIQTDIELIPTFEEWKKTVTRSQGHYDAIVIGLYFTIKDPQGNTVKADDIIKWTAQHTKIPPFAFWDFAVGEGKAIGGLVLYGKTQGIAAAKMAKEILNGKDIKTVFPKIAEKGRYFFSKSGLEKFDLELPSYITQGLDYSK